jgi:hypothetical protein
MKTLSKLRAFALLATFAFALTSFSHAILDLNNNGLSDVWEEQHNNGELYPATFFPTADPDQDGWDNATEAVAGTDPFEPNPPDGIVVTQLEPSQTQGAYTLTWPTIVGKRYRLQASYDLDTWSSVGNSHFATESSLSIGINAVQLDTTVPPKIFWRIIVGDVDDDGDRLTNAEEYALGTNPASIDTDGDLISDWQELMRGLNPTEPDSDGDGASDIDETLAGKDPNSSNSHPPIFESAKRGLRYSSNEEDGFIADWNHWEPTYSQSEITAPGQSVADLGTQLASKHPFTEEPEGETDKVFFHATLFQYRSELSTYYTTSMEHMRVWANFDEAAEEDLELPYLEILETILDNDYENTVFRVKKKTHLLNEGDIISQAADIMPDSAFAGNGYQQQYLRYVALYRAPEVLAVNSDFDEGRVDTDTGYAIPDCDDTANVDQKTGSGNTTIALHAAQDHLDGYYRGNDIVYEDLHPGWFGLIPTASFSEIFFEGATITIEKIDQIDADTGYAESGQVRFYASWPGGYYGIETYDMLTLAPKNLVTGGINGRSGEGVYGPTSTIPPNAKFFMEGVRPGKITLKWKYSKGDQEAEFSQTFKVETRQSLSKWRDEVNYQIRLQSKAKTGKAVDLRAYHPGNGFRNTSSSQPAENDNQLRVLAIYYYYQQLFKQKQEGFMWAGMAKTAAGPIYAGMCDMTSWWQAQQIPGVGGADGGTGTEYFIEGLLLGGQKAIFADKAWAHRAYTASGRGALDWVENNNPESTDYDAWRLLDQGIISENQNDINSANHDLLEREQFEVVQSYYHDYTTTKFMKQPPLQSWLGAVAVAENSNGLVNTGEWLSANANKNPMPGGPKFHDVVPGGRIDTYQDRWTWTANAANGMLSIWTGEASDANAPKFDSNRRLTENNKTMYSAAAPYSFDTGGLPIE